VLPLQSRPCRYAFTTASSAVAATWCGHRLCDGSDWPFEHARASGAIVIEGYPVDPEGDRVDQAAAYVGTVGLFEAHGFERILQTEGRSGGKRRWLVRRRLT
jgi:hypothetical protein